MNFLKLFCDSFNDNWDNPAITSYSTGLTLTYGSIAARIERVVRLLAMINVKPGDHIAILGRNSIDWITNYMAAVLYGAVAVTVHVTRDTDEMLSMLATADIDLLFADPELIPPDTDMSLMPATTVISQDTQTVLYCDDERRDRLQGTLNDLDVTFVNLYPGGFLSSDLLAPELRPEAPAAIFFTSGTTGAPRPVLLTVDCLEGNTIYGIKTSLFPRGSRALTSGSVSTVWGVMFNVFVPLASGACIVVSDDYYNTEALIRSFVCVKPSRIILSPLQLEPIYTFIERYFYRTRTYRFLKLLPFSGALVNAAMRRTFNKAMGGNCREVLVGATNIGRHLRSKLSNAGIHYSISYGMVESGGLICYTHSDGYMSNAVGRSANSLLRTRVRPVELEGFPENAGILEVSGMTVMKGYYNDPEGTREVMTADGWMSTRDVAVIDEDGYVSVLGCMDTLIPRPGGVIVPERLEESLTSDPAIRQAVVVDRDGVLTAIIYPDAHCAGDNPRETVERIVAEVNDRVPAFIHIDKTEVSGQPLDTTLKGTVARYKYY